MYVLSAEILTAFYFNSQLENVAHGRRKRNKRLHKVQWLTIPAKVPLQSLAVMCTIKVTLNVHVRITFIATAYIKAFCRN
jgi:hypothetical protein